MFVTVITGIGGDERYLARPDETTDERKADRFTTERAALEAGRAHIHAFPHCIAKAMSARAEKATCRSNIGRRSSASAAA